MDFRDAKIEDIKQMKLVRNSVKENKLSNPDLIKDEDYKEFLTKKGKGWVCEIKNQIVAFAVVDLVDNNVWALFVAPRYADQGIGKQLHNMMLNWYFQQTKTPIWLGTEPNTRAEEFYRLANWAEIGKHGKNEIKFEMTYDQWMNS